MGGYPGAAPPPGPMGGEGSDGDDGDDGEWGQEMYVHVNVEFIV